jgi:MFS family permease
MKEKLKSIGAVLLWIGVSIGMIFLAVFLIKGGLWLGEILYPWLTAISAVTFIVCLLILLPLSFFRKSRAFAGLSFFIASYIFGVGLWVWAFLLTYALWGTVALLIGLFMAGIGVVPMAMLATIFHGEWGIFGQLVLLLLFTFGSRMLGLYLGEKVEESTYELASH